MVEILGLQSPAPAHVLLLTYCYFLPCMPVIINSIL